MHNSHTHSYAKRNYYKSKQGLEPVSITVRDKKLGSGSHKIITDPQILHTNLQQKHTGIRNGILCVEFETIQYEMIFCSSILLTQMQQFNTRVG